MSTRSAGRHRAPARSASPLLAMGQSSGPTGAVAKTGAVIAVSSGLVASLALQAHAATPLTADAAGGTTEAGNTTQQSWSAPVSLVSSVAKAPTFGDIGFTSRAAPVKRKSVVKVERKVAKLAPATRRQHSASKPSRSTAHRAAAAPAPVHIKAGAPGSADFGAAVMAIAARYAGIAYRYGGTTPAGFDCSGYTSYVFRQVGIELPRTSSAQRAATTRVSRSEAVPGDLVFMPGHVGIYAGNGMMWDSPRSGKDVARRPVWSSSATYGRVG